MALDYTEVTIGPPSLVFDKLARRLGELNYSSQNIKIGITRRPETTYRSLNNQLKWAVMKLVYATNSMSQASQLARMLRAWDAKLYVDTKEMTDEHGGEAAYYAFVVIR